MANLRVKKKVPAFLTLFAVACLTVLASLMGGYPERLVESAYAKTVFPPISHIVGVIADSVPFSWLDVGIPLGIAGIVYGVRQRRWYALLGLASAAYLWFFWTWGINYHRPPLALRLSLNAAKVEALEDGRFIDAAVRELNKLSPVVKELSPARDELAALAASRVRTVVGRIDGHDWPAAARIKRSWIADGWFQIAGIDGAFNPFGHEPLLASGLLTIELPFVMSHELAHVRGVPNEGDANLVALFATVASDNPVFQYSGWLHLWMYLATPARNAKLDPAVRADLHAIYERGQSLQIPLARNVQTAVLDLHLKANDVDDGVASYSNFVALAVASWDRWEEYR